jgi:DNA-binding transcriptional ArsR family regulator
MRLRLNEVFQTGQSRLSFHLKVLEEAGLVIDRPEGRWIYYSVNGNALEELEEFIVELKKNNARSNGFEVLLAFFAQNHQRLFDVRWRDEKRQ